MADQRVHVIGYEGGPPLEAGVNWGCAALRVGEDVINGCSGSRGPNTDDELRAMGVRLLPTPHPVRLDLAARPCVIILELAADLVMVLEAYGAPLPAAVAAASTVHGATKVYLLPGHDLSRRVLRVMSNGLAVVGAVFVPGIDREIGPTLDGERLLAAAEVLDCQAPIVRGLRARRRGDELGAALARASMRSDEDRATLERLLAASDEGLRAVLAGAVARG